MCFAPWIFITQQPSPVTPTELRRNRYYGLQPLMTALWDGGLGEEYELISRPAAGNWA